MPAVNRRQLTCPSASPEQAAAISAALEQFMRDHTPPPVAPAAQVNAWLRTALLEGVDRQPDGLSSWGDAHLWR